MARDLLIVGSGDYYEKLVIPSLNKLRDTNLIKSITTIDIKKTRAQHTRQQSPHNKKTNTTSFRTNRQP